MHERDAERFVAHYAPQITKFDLAPPLVYEGPEARDTEALRAWFASHPGGPVGYEIRDLVQCPHTFTGLPKDISPGPLVVATP